MKSDMITTVSRTKDFRALSSSVKEIGPMLETFVEADEMQRRLSQPVITSLREAGFYRLFMPESLGGLELDPLTTAKLVEEIAGYNTAAAWSIMVANTATWWCSRLSDEGIDEIYADGPDTFVAGAFHPPMKATPEGEGYRINGRSPLTSNIHEAQWIFVTAFVMDGDKMKMNNGIPEILGVFMHASECKIIDTWYTLGMRATDSNDVNADGVYVPYRRTYFLTPELKPNKHYKGALYRYAAIGASIASLIAPIALAVGDNAIKELKLLATRKVPFGSMVAIREKGSVQRKLGMAEAFVQSSRAYLHHEIADTWNKTEAGVMLSMENRAALLLAITHTNQTCLQAVELMYSAGGSSSIYTSNKLSHHFLNAQVIRQHGFSNESRYETAAQIYFGLQPDLPVVVF